MAEYYIYIKIDPYLAQWFINDQGGNNPVKLRRGSLESEILELYLQCTPKGVAPSQASDDSVAIILPNFKSKDTRDNNYLPEHAEKLLVSLIRNRFDVCMWTELHKFGNMVFRLDETIYAFMEHHGIELTETNWNAIAKRYQRKRNIYLTNSKRKLKKSSQLSQ